MGFLRDCLVGPNAARKQMIILSKLQDESPEEAIDCCSEEGAKFWTEKGYRAEPLAPATGEELDQIDQIEQFLIENYERGAHWVYETTDSGVHLYKLRKLGFEEYKADMSATWKVIHDYAEDIRNA